MDILSIAEDNFIISFGIVIGIGLIQGVILGRGIRNRFPSLKKHARIVSLIIFTLFSINAAANIIEFALPEKIPVSELTIPTTPEEGFSFLINLMGLDAGPGTIIIFFISISLILFFKLAHINKIARYFIFALSAIVLLTSLLARFTDFVPTTFQILMYAFYQFGITVGLFLVTRRKEQELENFS